MVDWILGVVFFGVCIVIAEWVGYNRGRSSMMKIIDAEHAEMCRHLHSLTVNEYVAQVRHRYLGAPSNAAEIWKRRAEEVEKKHGFEITNAELKALEAWAESRTTGFGPSFTNALSAAQAIRGRHKRDEVIRGKR